MLQRNGYFCTFSRAMLLGKMQEFLFPPTTKNIDTEITSYLVQAYGFQLTFFRLLIVRMDLKEKIHSKVANCFSLKVLKLVNVTN